MHIKTTSWSSKLTMMHELIDREDPRCLYCKSDCDIQLGYGFLAATPSYNVDILTCRKCNERFEIHWLGDIDPTQITAFVFTCKKWVVFFKYDAGFSIGGKELLWGNKSPHPTSELKYILPFEVDFSDKKKLQKKLKTYLTFS